MMPRFDAYPESNRTLVIEKILPLFNGMSVREAEGVLACLGAALSEMDRHQKSQPLTPFALSSLSQAAPSGQ